jgi:hypothetical protein
MSLLFTGFSGRKFYGIMVNTIAQPKSEVLAQDPRWGLVERIVASPSFVKSDRLCSFLTHICELSLTGRNDEINEVNIGARLFGRPDYDPSIDGIVRSHASRMRQRLEQYFSQEGAEEPIRLTIPKGAYIPVFDLRPCTLAVPEGVLLERLPISPEPVATNQEVQTQDAGSPWTVRILAVALGLACLVIAPHCRWLSGLRRSIRFLIFITEEASNRSFTDLSRRKTRTAKIWRARRC